VKIPGAKGRVFSFVHSRARVRMLPDGDFQLWGPDEDYFEPDDPVVGSVRFHAWRAARRIVGKKQSRNFH